MADGKVTVVATFKAKAGKEETARDAILSLCRTDPGRIRVHQLRPSPNHRRSIPFHAL